MVYFAILPLKEMSEIQKCPNLIRGGGSFFQKCLKFKKVWNFRWGGWGRGSSLFGNFSQIFPFFLWWLPYMVSYKKKLRGQAFSLSCSALKVHKSQKCISPLVQPWKCISLTWGTKSCVHFPSSLVLLPIKVIRFTCFVMAMANSAISSRIKWVKKGKLV